MLLCDECLDTTYAGTKKVGNTGIGLCNGPGCGKRRPVYNIAASQVVQPGHQLSDPTPELSPTDMMREGQVFSERVGEGAQPKKSAQPRQLKYAIADSMAKREKLKNTGKSAPKAAPAPAPRTKADCRYLYFDRVNGKSKNIYEFASAPSPGDRRRIGSKQLSVYCVRGGHFYSLDSDGTEHEVEVVK